MKRVLSLVVVAVGFATAFSACRGATEVLVDVRTNVPCTDPAHWKGVAIYAGAPGLDVETRAPVLTTTACDASGHVGSIAVVPSGAKDATVAVRVVAGIAHPPEECAEHAYAGCIVARRTLSFIAHESLSLDVQLTSDCVGLGCDAVHTCFAGACQDSRLSTTPPESDAGTSTPAGPTVRCGDNGVHCPTTGAVCCLTVVDGGTQGACMKPEDCPPTSATLHCDDEADCVGPDDDAGRPPVCCVQYETNPGANSYCASVIRSAQCFPYATCLNGTDHELGMCNHRSGCQRGTIPCAASASCPGNDVPALPGYFFCQLPGN